MKINIIKFLSNIQNRDVRLFLEHFINQVGMLKRDLTQNKSDQFKDQVSMPVWNCTKFILNKLSIKLNISFSILEESCELKNNIETNHVYYDLEDCFLHEQTVLCAIIIRHTQIHYLFLVDIINMNLLLIDNIGCFKLDLGPRIRAYKDSTKIYSTIYNAVIFKQHQTYLAQEDAVVFNSVFRPLYEKIYIQSGCIV